MGMALLCGVATAADADFDSRESTANPRIDEMVVTGMRQIRLAELPRSATVITAEDIALSPSTNIVDLIAREANVQLRAFVGNEKFSGVDIRGQGDTYASNVLVLVDGIRLNPADQAAPDYSSLPLDQVERIEVIRGANSVRYGNGAVGGVINIITRRAGQEGSPEGFAGSVRLRGGSFGTVDTGLGGSWAGDQWSFLADAAFLETDGYRDNSQLEKKDLSARIGFDPVDWFGLSLGGILHRDEFGFPGPLSKELYDGSDADRRSSRTPNDNGSTDDNRVRFDLNLGNATTGELLVSAQLRDRENPFLLSGTNFRITEDREAFDSKYQRDFGLWEQQHTFYVGFDTFKTDYAREVNDGLDETKQGDIRQQAWFAAIDLGLTENVKFSTGYRQDNFKIDSRFSSTTTVCVPDPVFPIFCQDTEVTVVDQDSDSWRNSAAEAGLVYSPTNNSNWFVSFSQSFRNPNVDDLVLSDGDLRPQSADHWDIGMRQFIGGSVEFSLAAFYSKTKDEILFGTDPIDPTLQVNRNADQPTKRKGAEADIRWYTTDTLRFTANAGYTNAKFSESNTYVPMVPKWTGGLGVQWAFLSDWVINANGVYVGRRFDGNDFNNMTYRKVDDYQVVDMKLSYQLGAMQFYGGIDNVFDEIYSPSVYSENYYPMPGRNYYAGMTYRMGL